MLITKEDFEEEFIKKFSEKHQNYIISFCNTFQKTFPGIIDKKTMIDRISWIKEISEKKLYRRKRKYNIFK